MNKLYDLAIVGGGVTGVGVAYEANKRGLSTVLIDAGTIANRTSANSLRIIHGGFRYLQSLNFKRTVYSLKAQTELLEEFPDLIQELQCLMPLDKSGLKSKYPAWIGAVLYSIFLKASGSKLSKPKVLSNQKAQEQLNLFDHYFKNDALLWSDAQLLDHSVLMRMHLDAVDLIENEQVKIIDYDQEYSLGLNSGQAINAKAVVNAAAYGAKQIELRGIDVEGPKLYWADAFNFVIPKIDNFNYAFAVEGDSGRMFFIVPRTDEVAIGTFYKAYQDDSINYSSAIDSFNSVCPELGLNEESLLRVEQGTLACTRPYNSEQDLLSAETIIKDRNYLEVYSPKYTTFRLFAKKILNELSSN